MEVHIAGLPAIPSQVAASVGVATFLSEPADHRSFGFRSPATVGGAHGTHFHAARLTTKQAAGHLTMALGYHFGVREATCCQYERR